MIAFIGYLFPFQSTHPAGGGTPAGIVTPVTLLFQSTHPVGGGTGKVKKGVKVYLFQSTHPVGGGTGGDGVLGVIEGISIHPPRGGWDCAWPLGDCTLEISIHPPRGGWD